MMKENEPKVKDSQKYWDEKKFFRGTIQHDFLFGLCEKDKATYDRLVTLEAKIELLEEMINAYKTHWIKELYFEPTKIIIESELAELVKKHSLY